MNQFQFARLFTTTMGGIEVDFNSETRIKGLFAVGECASSGLHGAKPFRF